MPFGSEGIDPQLASSAFPPFLSPVIRDVDATRFKQVPGSDLFGGAIALSAKRMRKRRATFAHASRA